ncbi:hypothetical protein TPR58_10515 [Sphingomonas sp. HF-S3]|uniref:Uncharacterized protein n=1 Tax=Sphingomonas rustica TaxID=3103142 RepID=A0ABV0B7P8_9SPHN
MDRRQVLIGTGASTVMAGTVGIIPSAQAALVTGTQAVAALQAGTKGSLTLSAGTVELSGTLV